MNNKLSTSLTLIELNSIDSTNTWALNACRKADLRCPFVVIAHQQTNGYGRLGRVWHSEQGKSICFSLVTHFDTPLPGWVGLAVGIQIHQHLVELGLPGLAIKWPNDILIHQEKLAGVLCQTTHAKGSGYLVSGIGINLHPVKSADFASSALSDYGVSLTRKQRVDWVYSMAQNICVVLEQLQNHDFSMFKNYFNQFDAFAGQQVELFQDGLQIAQGKALGVSDHGAYCVETTSGIEFFVNADVSLRVLNHA